MSYFPTASQGDLPMLPSPRGSFDSGIPGNRIHRRGLRLG
jgi:hypothetical protein